MTKAQQVEERIAQVCAERDSALETVAELEQEVARLRAVPISGSAILPRRRLPETRRAVTKKFKILTERGPVKAYATVGFYDDGTPGELFLVVDRPGETVRGLADAVATASSIALQHGAPVATLCAKMIGTRFEPAGVLDGPDRKVVTSILDAVFRWVEEVTRKEN